MSKTSPPSERLPVLFQDLLGHHSLRLHLLHLVVGFLAQADDALEAHRRFVVALEADDPVVEGHAPRVDVEHLRKGVQLIHRDISAANVFNVRDDVPLDPETQLDRAILHILRRQAPLVA